MDFHFLVAGFRLMIFGSPAFAKTLAKTKLPLGPKAPPSKSTGSFPWGRILVSFFA